MPGESLHAAAPSQCLVIITIIIINIIIIILLLITIIIRVEIRIFRHPFSKYPTVRWKWQVRASIGTAKRGIGVCANTDRVFFPAWCVCLTMYTSKWLFKWTKWWATMDIVGCSLFGSRYLRSALNVQFHAPPKWTLVTCLVRLFMQQPLRSVSSSASSSSSSSSSSSPSSSSSSSTCDSDFSTSICHVTLTFASKRVKQRNVGASPCFGWTENFPSFCQSGDLLVHDVHIDKPKAWCQQKRARSHVGFRTEWSPVSPVTQLPFVSPLLK